MGKLVRKKIMSVILALAMVVSLLPALTLPASAAVTYDSSKFGSFEGSETSVSDGHFVITGLDGDGSNLITVDSNGIYLGKIGSNSEATTGVIDIVSADSNAVFNMSSITVNFYNNNSPTYTFSITYDSSPTVIGSATIDASDSSTYDGINSNWCYKEIALNEQFASEVHVKISSSSGKVITSSIANFTIGGFPGTPPTVSTDSATSVTATTATGNATVIVPETDNLSQHGFVWSTNENPTISDSKTTEGAKSATGAFTSSITNLQSDTTYYIRAYATNSVGTAYGDNVTFKTAAANTAPTDISLSSTTVNENTSSGTTVGTLSATDADSGDTFTYSLVSGDGSTDNGSFSISGSSLKLAVSPDYETKNSYSVRIQTEDAAGATYSKAFTITVTDANDAPEITSDAAASFSENGTGTVYTATGTDDDGNAITWSISGTDSSLFSIDSSTGAVTFNASPDYETPSDSGTDNVYNITVTATDDGTGTLMATKDVAISVTNVNEAPSITSDATESFAENGTGTAYTAEASDPDASTTITWSIGGTDADLFSIGSDGKVTFKTAPDYENPGDSGTNNVYNITVTATDNGTGALTATKDITITVTDANDAPEITSDAAASFSENGTGTVYTVTGTDDDGNAITWSISGTDSSLFSIDSSTGAVTFNASPDYETPSDSGTDNVYNITVTATDDGTGTLTATKDVAISVTNVNEAPSITSDATESFAENGTGTAYTAEASDPDASTTITWSIGGTDADLFSIGSDGKVTFKTAPDYENPGDSGTNNVYNITVTATDNGTGALTATKDVAITVTDANDAPEITSDAAASFSENGTGTVYTATGTDDDGNAITWSISGTDSSLFSIDSSTGAVTFNASPDYETPSDSGTDNVYNITVTATDDGTGTLMATKDVAISVTNVNEAPSITSDATESFAENGTGTAYTAEASDPDASTTITWSIGGTDADLFSIGSDGKVTFKTAPDYENPGDSGTNNVYNITVTATDNGTGALTATKDVTITVTDANDAPEITSDAAASFSENGTGTVYTVTGTDDDGNAITWSISGTDSSLFSIDSSTGAVTFNASPDYETPSDSGTDNVYNITVTATDDGTGTLTATKDVAISVTNVNEAPSITSDATESFAENGTGTAYTAEASDPDASTTITWSIGGTDADLFSIGSDGKVTFKTAPDYENPGDSGTNNVYNITVTATDNGTGALTATKDVAITVTDANDAPEITSDAAASFSENGTGTVYTATGTDDDGNAITWSISGTDSSLFSIDSSTGAVTFNASPDYETPSDSGTDNVYNITVTATDDGTGTLMATKDVAISVTNVNEAPSITSDATESFAENGTGTAYTAEASDPDASTTITWSIGGTDADLFSIGSDGKVTFKTAPDYENPGDSGTNNVYNITVTATDNGTGALTATKDITITVTDVKEATAANSTVAASTASVLADGTATSTITVTLKDKNNDLVDGKTVTLTQDSGSSTITPDSATTNSSGEATFTVKSTTAEAVTYTATDTTDGVTVTQTATVTFTVPTYTATISTQIDGTKTDMTGVVLKNDSSTYVTSKTATGVYTATVVNGTYDVYVDGMYTGVDITINYAAENTTVNYYTVAFNSQGGGSVASQTVLSGGKVAIPAAPAKSGNTFAGWYTDTGYGTAWNFSTETISTAMSLYAKWTPVSTYRVAYSGNSNTSGIVPVDTNSYTSGATVTVKSNTGSLAKTGNTFAGWSDGTTTYSAGQTFTISGDVTLNAVWTAVASSYAATYSNNYTSGGTYTTQTGISAGATLTAPAVLPRSGYTFIGWYKEADCVNPWNFSVDTITANTTLYAKWSENTYSVSGTVKDDITPTPNSVSGATIRVMQGNVLFGETVTTSNGTFTVTGVPNGIYNLVVTKGSQEITVRITVSGVNYPADTVTLPSGNKNSTLEVNGSGTPNVVVDKLNGVFGDSGVYTPADDNDVTNNGATVEIKLTVQKNDSSADKTTVEATMTSGGYTTGMVLDVDMTKTVTTSSGEVTSKSAVPKVNTLIMLVIPLPAELQGKDTYVVTRAHDYNDGNGIVVDTITTTANAAGEKMEISSDKTQLTLYVKYFSTYAIGYTTTSSTGGGSTASYTITATSGTGGSISPSSVRVVKGGSKTFTITADEGYVINDVLVDGESVGAVGSYTFNNVSENHAIEAVFAEDFGLPYYLDEDGNEVFIGFAAEIDGEMVYIAPDGATVLVKQNTKSFSDTGSHWAQSHIDFVTGRELLTGTGSDTFSPDAGMTRAMFATVIGRLYERSYGEIESTDARSFTDCDYDDYYGKYVDWAAKEGVIGGYGNGEFEPNDQISREQMAAILYRFANFLGVLPADTGAELNYPDAGDISSWAQNAALYCQSTGIITGRDGGNFAPQGTATRAEVAVMLERFIENILG